MMANIIASVDKKLISILTKKQRQGRLSDCKFANKLGISRALWQATRSGRIAIGLTLIRAIIKTYPELLDDIINYLSEEQ